jgi:hypothetical protein
VSQTEYVKQELLEAQAAEIERLRADKVELINLLTEASSLLQRYQLNPMEAQAMERWLHRAGDIVVSQLEGASRVSR